VYEEMPGWKQKAVCDEGFATLPGALKNYIGRVEELAGVPVDIVSLGAEREETLVRRSPFAG